MKDKTLSSPDAEAGVLAAILIDDSNYPMANKLLSPDDFTSERNRRIFEAMKGLEVIDQVTVAQHMRDMNTLEDGDCAYLRGIVSRVPSSLHCKFYAQIVKDLSNRRAAINQASIVARDAYSGKLKKRRGVEI